MRRHRFLIFDMMFVFAVNCTLKPDIKIVFCRVGFNLLKCDSIIVSLDCFNGGIFICLTPNRHHTILPIRDIECNSNIILRFIASHLLGGCGNIANDRSKRSLIGDVQFAVFCIICPYAIGVLRLSVGKQSCHFERHIFLFRLCARIRIGDLYFISAIYTRIEFCSFLIGVGKV